MQTEQIDKLAAALAKAQGEIGSAAKKSENPHFHSKYADLASVVEAIREPFATNGLAYQQPYRNVGDQLSIVTRVIHASGQWIEDDGVPLLLSKQDMQGIGSASTYARRYGLMAAAGVAPAEDDDGNAAVGKTRDTGKPVPVKRGTAKRGAPASNGEKPEPPAKPHAIDVPTPANSGGMKAVWEGWCKEFIHAIGTCEDVETMNAWIYANEEPFKSLYTFSKEAHAHVDKQIKAKVDTLAPVAAE